MVHRLHNRNTGNNDNFTSTLATNKSNFKMQTEGATGSKILNTSN